MTAQLVKRFVVFFFFQMRQFMNDNHTQKGFGGIAKNGRHADLRFSFELSALHARNGGMQPQRILQNVDLAVIHDFIQRRGVTQKLIFQILSILPERFVGREVMRTRIALLQHCAQALLSNQRSHLRK